MLHQSGEVAILANLLTPIRLQALSRVSGCSYPTAYRLVRGMAERGLLVMHREGRDLVAASASRTLAGDARSVLSETPRDDWDWLLRGHAAPMLLALHRTGTPELAAAVCGRSRSAAYAMARHCGIGGILLGSAGRYRLNPRLPHLERYLDELNRVEALHRLQKVDAEATLLWSLGPECLIRSGKDLRGPGIRPAAFTRFADFGIDIGTGESSYFHLATRKLGAADAILEALLLDRESTIYHSYCALLYEKVRPSSLIRNSPIYGLRDEAEALKQYVDTRKGTERFLPWHEHDGYRRLYGVGP